VYLQKWNCEFEITPLQQESSNQGILWSIRRNSRRSGLIYSQRHRRRQHPGVGDENSATFSIGK